MVIKMAWSPALARDFVADMIERKRGAVNDLSDEIERLDRMEDEDFASPEIFRAYVRGACGYDVAKDCTMQKFAYVVAGDRHMYMQDREWDERIEKACADGTYAEIEPALTAWRNAFSEYHHGLVSTPAGARAMGVELRLCVTPAA